MTIVRAHLLIGGEVSNFSTMRRGTAAAGMIPVLTMPKPSGSTGGAFSQGRRPAESRHASSDPRTTEWRSADPYRPDASWEPSGTLPASTRHGLDNLPGN
jgi:hypothetical protein